MQRVGAAGDAEVDDGGEVSGLTERVVDGGVLDVEHGGYGHAFRVVPVPEG